MALHPQARALLDQIEESGLPPLNELDPDAARVQAALLNEFVGAGPDVARLDEFSIPTSAGEIAARRYVPEDPAGVVLWIHGGGWVICDLGGDSAGGNMAAVCALRARDRGGPELALQVLVYPATDCDLTTPSNVQHGSGPETFLTTDEMRYFWSHYIADPERRTNPEASPLLADDLSRLPPAIVLTAEYDPLRDEGLAYAAALGAAGVPVTHHHYDDMIHAFFTLVNLLERGNEAVAQVGGEIRAVAVRSTAPA